MTTLGDNDDFRMKAAEVIATVEEMVLTMKGYDPFGDISEVSDGIDTAYDFIYSLNDVVDFIYGKKQP